MPETLEERWWQLGGAADALAQAALEADDRLLRQSLLGLAGDPLPGLRTLAGIRWRWQLDQTTSTRSGIPGLSEARERPIVTIEVRCRLTPTPREVAPVSHAEVPMPVVVELPRWWRVPTPAALERYAPGRRSRADNTLLMDLGERVLAVRNPQRLLGLALRAKLWLDGTRLRREVPGWPAEPFLAWVAQLAHWLADPEATISLPLAGDPDDALPQAAGAVAAAHRRLERTLAQAPESDTFELPGLEARRILADFEAELALRVDMAGELADDGEKDTLTLRSLLEIERLAGGERLRWRLLPPSFLASRDLLADLLDALSAESRRSPWADLRGLRALLRDAREDPRVLAFRTEKERRRERWVLMIPVRRQGASSDYAVLGADFGIDAKVRGSDESTRGRPNRVVGGRRVLRWPTARSAAFLDDATVRALLGLMTALHRFGRAAT